MRYIHVIILLAATICCIADKDAVTAQADKQITGQQPVDTTTAIPKTSPSIIVSSITAAVNKINDSVVTPATVTSDHFVVTETPVNDTTTAHPVSSTSPSTTAKTVPSTTAAAATTTATAATVTTKKPVPTVTSNPSTVAPPPATTAFPVSTEVGPILPYKERHFDGLSFLGGIILATSLMAIGALSWKFYRTFSERSYRTL